MFNKGKGKGKSKQTLDPEAEYQSAIRAALPSAARIRMIPTLDPQEWNCPIKQFHDLSATGGVAIAYKDHIPQILQQVGYTLQPTAIVTTQHPRAYGLAGYLSHSIQCTFHIRSGDAEITSTQVKRHLIQLGFGDSVIQSAQGDLVHIPITMHKMVAKFPPSFDWFPEMITGSSVSSLLQEHVREAAIEDILVRPDMYSVTMFIHESEVDKLLRASGKHGVFYKMHKSSQFRPSFELCWLEDGTTLKDALWLRNNPDMYGIAAKNTKSKIRFAIRFLDVPSLQAFCQEQGAVDRSKLGRWKITGIPSTAGATGVMALLQSREWKEVEILYLNEKECIYVSASRGKCEDMFYNIGGGHKQQLRIKALNKVAETQQANASRESRVSASLATPPRRERHDWLLSQLPMMPTAPIDLDKDHKRPATARTGETPEPNRQRTTET